jgi:Flp pilus assembly protein TadG
VTARRRRTLVCDRAGATLVEFGFVAPVLMLMLMGLFDLSHRSYVAVVLQGAIERAGRSSTLQTGSVDAAALDASVQTEVEGLVGPDAVFTSSRVSYQNFSDVGLPEVFRDTTPANGR